MSESKKPKKWGIMEYGALATIVAAAIAVLAYLRISPSPHHPPVGPTSPSSSTSTSPRPSSPTTSPTGPPKPRYLVDLPVQQPGAFGGTFNTGVAAIGGKQYRNSFYGSACIVTPIIVSIPARMTTVSGVVGYTDDSFSKSGDASGNAFQVEIDESADAASANDTWRRIWLGTLTSTGVTRFSVHIDPGTRTLELTPVEYACSTDIGWGNPIVR